MAVSDMVVSLNWYRHLAPASGTGIWHRHLAPELVAYGGFAAMV